MVEGGVSGFDLKKQHAILVMLGWGVLMPIGMMMARYFKQFDPFWFYSHISIQGIGFLLGMADEFDLKQAVSRAGKAIDAKAFPDLDRFVNDTDKLQDEVDEIHRARNKILTSISRGSVDNRAIDTYDALTRTVVKDAAKLCSCVLNDR